VRLQKLPKREAKDALKNSNKPKGELRANSKIVTRNYYSKVVAKAYLLFSALLPLKLR
jgi:hypothetical protein